MSEEQVKTSREEQQEEQVEKLVLGKNDTFEKSYDFDELDLHIKVKMRYPTLRERARINAVREEILYGTTVQQPPAVITAYDALAHLDVCGIDVPEVLQLDKMGREDIAYKVGVDISQWMNRFRF